MGSQRLHYTNAVPVHLKSDTCAERQLCRAHILTDAIHLHGCHLGHSRASCERANKSKHVAVDHADSATIDESCCEEAVQCVSVSALYERQIRTACGIADSQVFIIVVVKAKIVTRPNRRWTFALAVLHCTAFLVFDKPWSLASLPASGCAKRPSLRSWSHCHCRSSSARDCTPWSCPLPQSNLQRLACRNYCSWSRVMQ